MQKLLGASNAHGSARSAALASGSGVNSWLLISTRRPCTQRDVGARFRHSATSSKSVGSDADLQQLPTQPISPAEQHACNGLQPPLAQQQLLPPATPTSQQTTSIHSPLEHHGHPHSSQPSLKYAQMGHSRFGRGAPHVCYWHLDGKGLFYVKPDMDELIRGWQLWLQQQRQQLGLAARDAGQLATSGVEGQSNSYGTNDTNPRWQQKLLSVLQSSTLLPALAAAAAAVVALAAAIATATVGHTGSAAEQQQDWGFMVLRVLSVAVVAGLCSIGIAQLGRRMVAFLLLCYSGLSML